MRPKFQFLDFDKPQEHKVYTFPSFPMVNDGVRKSVVRGGVR